MQDNKSVHTTAVVGLNDAIVDDAFFKSHKNSSCPVRLFLSNVPCKLVSPICPTLHSKSRLLIALSFPNTSTAVDTIDKKYAQNTHAKLRRFWLKSEKKILVSQTHTIKIHYVCM